MKPGLGKAVLELFAEVVPVIAVVPQCVFQTKRRQVDTPASSRALSGTGPHTLTSHRSVARLRHFRPG